MWVRIGRALAIGCLALAAISGCGDDEQMSTSTAASATSPVSPPASSDTTVAQGAEPESAAAGITTTTSAGDQAAPDGRDPIVVDHTSTDPSRIPQEWVVAAQEVVWAYGSTSHGTQLWAGAQNLNESEGGYSFAADWRHLPERDGLLMAYDDGWSWDGGAYYDTAVGLLADVPEATAFMWSWCGEMSDPGTDVGAYLDAMERLAGEYPEVTFVFMTGHTDGGSAELAANNERVRRHVADHGGVLFDFADIEAHDPEGHFYPDAVDGCDWCDGWCGGHGDDCAGLGGFDCAHSHPFTCRLKAGALWWLSARLAGWDGAI